MKKLSKDERLGALALALVIIAIMGGMAFLRSCDIDKTQGENPQVNIIYDGKNGEGEGSDGDYRYYGKKSGGSKKKSGGRKKSGGSGRRGSASKELPPARDFLDDTIPIEYDDDFD